MALGNGGVSLTTEIVWLAPFGVLLLGYLLGSVPFGLLLTRGFGAGDLRTIGSGNIGATNVLRTGRKGLAAATLVLDAAKGAAAVLIAEALLPGSAVLGAIGAFLGHLYPVWLRFAGGKGLATLFGIVLALHWPAGIVYAVVWLGMLALLRFSSVAGMTAAVAAPLAMAWFDRFDFVLPLIAMALLALWKHRGNIERLLNGTEPRVGTKTAEVAALDE
ncbi:MAG: glycerol-3-phosphate 1-O-acyltransferase PlsY [Pseudomonadota bacterium]